MNRRDFLKTLSIIPLASVTPLLANRNTPKNHYLIMLELKGGNDSLNTFIPFTDDYYYTKRPTIAIRQSDVIKVSNDTGFNPALVNLSSSFNNKEMAVFNNVGYPNPNKSHFTSLDIVEKGITGNNGWAYEVMKNQSSALDGIVFSGSDGLFKANTPNFIKMKNIKNFVRQSKSLRVNRRPINEQVRRYNHTKSLIKESASILQNGPMSVSTYTPSNPESKFANQLVEISKIIKSNIDMPVLKLHLPGFDTHADQVSRQAELFSELDTSIGEFITYLKSQDLWNNSLIYSFSEFGRRIAENGNSGTDHGEAYSGFALGGKIQGGIYGNQPDLSKKNLSFDIDHRQLLATLETNWLKLGNNTGTTQNFSKINFIMPYFL